MRLRVFPSAPRQLRAAARERVDQPAAAVALDLARGPVNKLLAAGGLFAELFAVRPGHEPAGCAELVARKRLLEHLQPGVSQGELRVASCQLLRPVKN